MDKQVTSPLDKVCDCIGACSSFVLQGGAGSGKTETLNRTVQFVAKNHPEKKIVCITHTNKAVEEIIGRVGSAYEISTIHSFLSGLIKPYKKNLYELLPELFCLPVFERLEIEGYQGDDKAQKKGEHTRFKKLYEKLVSSRSIVLGVNTKKVTGKVEYDKNPSLHNLELNNLIKDLNVAVNKSLKKHHYRDVEYNETRFDSFKNGTFGHDGLIKITALLFEKYPLIGNILCCKYDCIFIDEYQDTDEKIIRSLLYHAPTKNNTTVGLFGDSEQAIYENGIGSAKEFVDDGKLVLIEKEDNFRCSPQVIKVANQFRSDGLQQRVALKCVDGVLENVEEREGAARLIYAIKSDKPKKPKTPGAKALQETKDEYARLLDSYNQRIVEYKAENENKLDLLIAHAQKNFGEQVVLKLPNRAVSKDANFYQLYRIFDERFLDVRTEIKRHLDRLQFGQLAEVLRLFAESKSNRSAFNRLIIKLKQYGFEIHSKNDKKDIHSTLTKLLDSEESAHEVMNKALQVGVVKISESHSAYLLLKDSELNRIANEKYLEKFKELLKKGCNTELRMLKYISENEEPNFPEVVVKEQFKERMLDIRIEKFFSELFSKTIKFSEILAFYKYEYDDSNFMTMHKTKGTGIENVLVVLDEYNWHGYDFASCFADKDENESRRALSRRLLYVACSRTKKSLTCVRLANSRAEAERMQLYFEDCYEIKV